FRIGSRVRLGHDAHGPYLARSAREYLHRIQERRRSSWLERQVKFPIARRRYVLDHPAVQTIRPARFRQRIQIPYTRGPIHAYREHARPVAAAPRVSEPILRFGKIQMQFVSPLPERNVIAEGSRPLRL